MYEERYDRLSLVGLILTLVLLTTLVTAWLREGHRMEAAAAEVAKERVLRGRDLYVTNCTSCHGTRGEGGAGSPLNSQALLKNAADETLVATIRTGRPGTIMPAWGQDVGGPLTEEDIRDVVSFLRAWEETAPLLATDAFEPAAARGARLFDSACFICHGEEGRGASAPAINYPARLAELDDDWYRQTILNGRPARGMPTWGTVLSPNQVEDLISLIQAWRGGEEVAAETTVAELLDSALFTLSQGDVDDALFYLRRAEPLAFGPALEQFRPISAKIRRDHLDEALTDLGSLATNWPVGDDEAGETVYQDICRSCHGAEGQGGVGRRLKPNEFVRSQTNAQMLQFLRTGRAGTAMRSFADRLDERQLADVISFLRSWQDG